MTGVLLCIHDLPAGACSPCTGRGEGIPPVPRPDPAGFGPWFDARLHGRCAGCVEPIVPGDRIRADGEGSYLCDSCGDPPSGGVTP